MPSLMIYVFFMNYEQYPIDAPKTIANIPSIVRPAPCQTASLFARRILKATIRLAKPTNRKIAASR